MANNYFQYRGTWYRAVQLDILAAIEDKLDLDDLEIRVDMLQIPPHPDTSEPNSTSFHFELVHIKERAEDGSSLNESVIALWTLTEMPGCNGIVISTDSFVAYDYRGKGLGTLLNTARIQKSKALGFSVMLCTHNVVNNEQQAILDTNGWRKVFGFINDRTGHVVAASILLL